jgi:hypothetical protein
MSTIVLTGKLEELRNQLVELTELIPELRLAKVAAQNTVFEAEERVGQTWDEFTEADDQALVKAWDEACKRIIRAEDEQYQAEEDLQAGLLYLATNGVRGIDPEKLGPTFIGVLGK